MNTIIWEKFTIVRKLFIVKYFCHFTQAMTHTHIQLLSLTDYQVNHIYNYVYKIPNLCMEPFLEIPGNLGFQIRIHGN